MIILQSSILDVNNLVKIVWNFSTFIIEIRESNFTIWGSLQCLREEIVFIRV